MNATTASLRSTAHRSAQASGRPVAVWLLVCCAMIFAMAVIGAITRLTESGLSIMEWAPVTGALPPLDEAELGDVFESIAKAELKRRGAA